MMSKRWTAGVLGVVVLASSANAGITLPGWIYPNYSGPVSFVAQPGDVNGSEAVYTSSTLYTAGENNTNAPGTATADGLVILQNPVKALGNGAGQVEDTWGVGNVTEITVAGANSLGLSIGTPLWVNSPTSQLTFTYYGIIDEKVSIGPTGAGDIASMGIPASTGYRLGGAYIDFYWQATNTFASAVASGPSGRSGPISGGLLTAVNVTYPGITSGTHWLSLQILQGADGFATSNTVERSRVNGSAPYNSIDTAFANPASSLLGLGSDNSAFGPAWNGTTGVTDIPADQPLAFKINVPVQATALDGNSPVPYGWTTSTAGSTATVLAYIIPEPTTGVLVGLGLAFAAMVGRKHRRE